MPNHVYSTMIVTGASDIIKDFAEKHFNKGAFDLNSFIPMPEELHDTTSSSNEPNPALIEKYGFDNWYDWSNHNWNTKWGTYDADMDVSTPTNIECNFVTAWSLPMPVFNKMAEMYPDLTFHLACVEEGGNFSGTLDIVDGIVNDDNITEDQDQWKSFAKQYMGWDFSAEEEETCGERIQTVLDNLVSGEVSDRSIVREIVLFVNEHMDDFIKFSKPK